MASRKFYYWKIIFASFATACGNNPPAFNNVLAIVKNREHEIFDRGVNQFCDYMEFTENDFLMYPCNITEEISKLNSLSVVIKKHFLIHFKEFPTIQHTV